MMKYVFVTGGVVSSLGKGTTAASLGRLLKARGYKVAMQKCDTYYNFNPALLSPLQHGENFITEDGVAADLDLGHYERFIDESLKGEASITTGKIHTALVERELRGEYHGATITVVPHVTNEIKHRIITAAENSGADIAIIEIGGVAGDIESSPYLEAIRQLKWELGAGTDAVFVRCGRNENEADAALCQGPARHRHSAGCYRLPHRGEHQPVRKGQNRAVLQCAGG